MMMTDPIADMLTRIRNAIHKSFQKVKMPSSKLKVEIANVMKSEGYIEDYEIEGEAPKTNLVLHLKYKESERVLQGLKRISRPGIRKYVGKTEIPRVMGGFGTAVLTTSKGVLAGKKARQLGIGGEVLCYLW
ncbi:30S ribosomal protein S8 [bacterium]|nr:30S ribosomal protein S8 [bacterium]